MKDLQEDNLFRPMRERLGRYEEAPSAELWEKIASRKREGVWRYLLEPVGVVVVGTALLLGGVEEVKTERVKTERVKTERVKTERVKTERVKTERVKTERVKTEEIAVVQEIQREDTPGKKEEFVSQQVILRDARVQRPEFEIQNSEFETEKPTLGSPLISPKDSLSITEDSSSITEITEVVPPFKKPRSRFQLYLSVTPSLSFQKMSPLPDDDIIMEGFAPRSPLSIKRFGFAIDVGFQRDINRFLGFYGGISFYHQHQEISYNYFNKEGDVTRVGDSWTFDIVRKEQARSFDYDMTNLGVRSGLLVTVKGEKLKHKFGAGLLYIQGFAKSSGAYNNNGSRYLAYQLSYRNELWINDRFSWFVEPVFTYSFLSKEKLDQPFKLKPYRAGISTGLLYRF